MLSMSLLNQQNHKITELSNVLDHLITDRALCDTQVTCDLFFTYVDKVREHLEMEERELYQPLLVYSNAEVRNTANKFLAGSGEIKRVFSQYLKRWCKNKELRINDHTKFVNESREMFSLVLRRIEDEVEHLYPTVRNVAGDKIAA